MSGFNRRAPGGRLAVAAAMAAALGVSACADGTTPEQAGMGSVIASADGAGLGAVSDDFGDALVADAARGDANGFVADHVRFRR